MQSAQDLFKFLQYTNQPNRAETDKEDPMLGPNDLCLCCGTIAHASFQELVEAAAAGGFRAVSIWPQHYEDARAAGLSDSDMRLMLENYGLVISELDPRKG